MLDYYIRLFFYPYQCVFLQKNVLNPSFFFGFLHQFQILPLNLDSLIQCRIATKRITQGTVRVYTLPVPVPSAKPLVVWPNVILL